MESEDREADFHLLDVFVGRELISGGSDGDLDGLLEVGGGKLLRELVTTEESEKKTNNNNNNKTTTTTNTKKIVTIEVDMDDKQGRGGKRDRETRRDSSEDLLDLRQERGRSDTKPTCFFPSLFTSSLAPPHLGFKSHVQHAICLIEDEILQPVQGNHRRILHLEKIVQAP
eukprot:747315-Hanusia_phi.AAC.2